MGSVEHVTVAQISVQDLASIGPSARIIDVREPNEWDDGHIAHATLVPLATVPGNIEQFDGAPTYVVCRSGGRSGQACEFLGEHGVDAVNVVGGMIAWTAAGFDVVTGSAPGTTGG